MKESLTAAEALRAFEIMDELSQALSTELAESGEDVPREFRTVSQRDAIFAASGAFDASGAFE